MQSLKERPAAQPRPAGALDEWEIRRSGPRTIAPVKVQLRQEPGDGKGSSRAARSVTGLAAKIIAGLSWLHNLLAGPPLSQRDRFRYSARVAQVQKHKAIYNLWRQQPTRGPY